MVLVGKYCVLFQVDKYAIMACCAVKTLMQVRV